MSGYSESGVVEIVKEQDKYQSVAFRGRKKDGKYLWFSNWGEPLSVGDVINFNYTEKGIYKNISNFERIKKEEQKDLRSPEPDYNRADTIKIKNSRNNNFTGTDKTVSSIRTHKFPCKYESRVQ